MTTPKKPILDVLRGLLQHRTDDAGCYEFVLECWIEEAANEIERLQSRWISVGERLPEEDRPVLVWMPDLPHAEHGTDIGYYIKSSWGVDWMVSGGRPAFPSHWMPLPAPPQVTPSVADVISHAEPKGQGHASGQIPGCLVDHDPYRHKPPDVSLSAEALAIAKRIGELPVKVWTKEPPEVK
jgi:hypothetical protein